MDEQQPQTQQIQLRIDESKMVTSYANMFRTTPTGDEVLIDAGLHVPSQGQDGRPVILFSVGSRLVLSWGGAKRLVMQLGQLVRQHEERNGEIPMGGVGTPPPPGPSAG